MASGRIPYATEQGIFGRVSGKIFRGTGIFDRGSKFVSVHCSHACFAPGERDLFSPAFLQSEEEQIFVTADIADASAPSDASPSEEERVP
jgi:hypothetical protein